MVYELDGLAQVWQDFSWKSPNYLKRVQNTIQLVFSRQIFSIQETNKSKLGNTYE